MMKIKIKVDIPKHFLPKVFISLDFISQTAKIPIEINKDSYEVYYGLNNTSDEKIFFRFNPEYYNKNVQFKMAENKWIPDLSSGNNNFDGLI